MMPQSLLDLVRQINPLPSVVVGRVTAHNADGTSTIELPSGLVETAYAAGVATGSCLSARGIQVPVGQNAFVRLASAGSGPIVADTTSRFSH